MVGPTGNYPFLDQFSCFPPLHCRSTSTAYSGRLFAGMPWYRSCDVLDSPDWQPPCTSSMSMAKLAQTVPDSLNIRKRRIPPKKSPSRQDQHRQTPCAPPTRRAARQCGGTTQACPCFGGSQPLSNGRETATSPFVYSSTSPAEVTRSKRLAPF